MEERCGNIRGNRVRNTITFPNLGSLAPNANDIILYDALVGTGSGNPGTQQSLQNDAYFSFTVAGQPLDNLGCSSSFGTDASHTCHITTGKIIYSIKGNPSPTEVEVAP